MAVFIAEKKARVPDNSLINQEDIFLYPDINNSDFNDPRFRPPAPPFPQGL